MGKLESSIEMAINDTPIDDVIITGDFNDNQLDHSRTKISFLFTKFSLLQMIDEPTHFSEHSSSLIDLILTNNVNRLIYTGVEPALTELIRYLINYPKTLTKPFKRKMWLYEHADYEKLRQNLFNVNWDSLFLTDDIELITNDITNSILSAAESFIPSKIVTIRKGGPKWLSCNIRKMIRQKNRIHRKAKHFNNPMHWNKFRKIRNEVTSLVHRGARGTDPPPFFLTFCLQIIFNKISLLFHLFFLILTCSCQYSYNLMLTSNCMCRPY